MTSKALYAAACAVGLLLLVDGLLRGEPRHKAVAVVLGAALLVPGAVILLGGERTRRIGHRLALSFVALVLVLVLTEGAVRAFDLRAFTYPEVVSDPIYGHVHVPGRGGLDAWGHRNARVPKTANIVCIGDSQTFGTSVRQADNYPSALARETGLEVYNMSLGGYGPLQYVELAKEALTLQPDTVSIGFYFGNDLADAFRFLGLEHWSALRDPALTYPALGDVNHGDKRSLNLAMAAVDWVMLHSWVVRKIGNEAKLAAKLSPLTQRFVSSDQGGVGYDHGSIPTRFQPGYRMGCMDLARPELQHGLRVTERCFQDLSALFQEANVRPLLLLIHNKEFYYHELMRGRDESIPESLQRLVELERVLTTKIIEFAGAAGMDVVDPTDELVSALAEGTAIYPSDVDAHLNRAGSAIAARALARVIDAR